MLKFYELDCSSAPLLSAVLITVFLHPLKKVSVFSSIAACAVSFAGSVLIFAQQGQAKLSALEWATLPGLKITIGGMADPLACLMLLVVTGVGLLIHIFAYGYMKEDPGLSRFFAKLSLFMFSMLGIVLADNLVMMFIFWELVGLSSYLLIGFWFQRPSAAEAAKKAFVVNRIGDFGFILGIIAIWALFGSVHFDELKQIISSRPDLVNAIAPGVLTLAAFGLFMGCMGKSAQVPLHVWLPDAMEGPTPVSALIHAATMVAAGVYMLCRVFFILELSVSALQLIMWIGAITSVFAALIALQQNDIKRILAYSTLSQLGYMVMAVGCSATTEAMFHLGTHAFFKALLFLAAGSVIHGLHHEQDIWKMGNLKKYMPITFATFLVGTLALTGFPGLSGFFSKESILFVAYHKNIAVFAIGMFTAFLTAFYMTRLFVVAFLGRERTEDVAHAHESPKVMTIPLMVLAVLSVIGGFIGMDHYVGHHAVEHDAGGYGLVMGLSILCFLLGTGLAWFVYHQAEEEPCQLSIFKVLRDKFYSDEIYEMCLVKPQAGFGQSFGSDRSLAGRWFAGPFEQHHCLRWR
ncbi:MAG: NADH-quinone oxidoreductase subunit L [Blastochloris sp.]|nr:NADH-quinone oxidoreductase subunit L [Blastochloris sp.]